MELNALKIFVKVVQTGSFTRAAEALDSQKAYLSRVITQLEEELNARLLERTTRSLSLTEVGRDFYERAVSILASVEDAKLAIQQTQTEPRGTLKLTCGVEFGMLAVGSWIRSYMRQFPQMLVDVDFTGRVVDIVHEGYDLAIRVGPLPDSNLMSRKIGDLTYGLYASTAYLDAREVPTDPSMLKSHELLVFTGGSHSSSWNLQRNKDHQKIDFDARLRANNTFTLARAAEAGLGIAKLPHLVAAKPLECGRLVEVLPQWSHPTVPVYAVFPSARYLTPKVRAFINLAIEEFV